MVTDLKDCPLFDLPPGHVDKESEFETYDKTHPEVWENFKGICFQLWDHGVRHYGAKAVFEVIRYHRLVESVDGYKVNNNWTASYARKLSLLYPQFRDFFELRKIHERTEDN